MSRLVVYPDAETTPQLLVRWTAAALCVAAVHVGTVYAVTNWPQPTLPSGEPPAAVMVELAPVPVAPEAPPQEVAVGPEQVMSEQSTPSEEKEVQPQPDKTEPQPEPKPQAEQTPPQPQPQPVDTPKLAEVPNAEAVLPAPPDQKPAEKPVEENKPDPPKPKEEQKETSRPQPQAKKAAAATSAPKPMNAPRAKANAAPFSGTASAASISSWRGTVVAHLNRHKRYPGGGTRGTSSVAFTIDRAGRVLSARLIRSSGSGVLDQEAVSLARRASPVPAPPANITGGSIVLTVPIRFSN